MSPGSPPAMGPDGRTTPADDVQSSAADPPDPVPGVESITVLHVDDEPDFADLVRTFLEREAADIEVRTEYDGEAALAALEAHDVDCVVSDYQMPGMDGLELLEAVRADDPDRPFILFTGKGSEEIASRAISAGVTDYLQKGADANRFTVLENRLRNAVARYRAERQVKRSFEAIASAREGISILDADGRFEYVNDAFTDIVGYTSEEILGEHWELLYLEESVDRVHEEILPSIPDEGRWTGETVYVRADGEHVLVDHALARTDEGDLVCLISELSESDGELDGPLVAEDTFVECVLDALEDVFYVLDAEGYIVRVNERATAVTEYSREELVGTPCTEVFAEADRPDVEAAFHETLETGVSSHEFRMLTRDGAELPFEFRTRRLTDAAGETIGLVGIGRDVTDRKRRERQLRRQATQFASFASVLSHDLKGPMTALGTRLELARETGETEHFEAAESALDRLQVLVDDLADVMREGSLTGEETAVDLGAVARRCFEPLAVSGVSLETADAPTIRADAEAVARLLENLLRNAVEHGDPGVSVRIGRHPDGFYVADDGPGIPEDEREAIFEPGFTTKDDGTGFGMVSVRQIALAHGWDVAVTESADGGARFEFGDVEFA